MKNTFYFFVILLLALLQASSTFSLEYSHESNTSMIDFIEKIGSAVSNILTQNDTPEFNISDTNKSNFQNSNFDISSILSDYLDVETGMLDIITIGKLLAVIVTTIRTIVIDQIMLLIRFV